jgi:hypothetical protein
MPDGISFDFSGITRLAADLGRVPETAGPLIAKALVVSATKGKKLWQANAKAHVGAGHAKAYPYSIDYDITNNAGANGLANELTAEIGPNLGRAQGALGIVEETPGGVRGTPQGNARKALAAISADFEKGVLIAAADAFERPRPA